jgi:AcrR family transcriptional regulator
MEQQVMEQTGKRQILVKAAGRVFAEQGFTATRVSDIAVCAGVGKGTVYEYFDSKEELFFAVFEWINAQVRSRVGAVLAEPGTAHDHLLTLFRTSAEIVVELQDLASMNLDFWAASRGSAFQDQFAEACKAQYTEYRRIVGDVVRRGQADGEFRRDLDADGLATLIVSALDGLGIQHWIDDTIDPTGSVESFADALCRGLCVEEE